MLHNDILSEMFHRETIFRVERGAPLEGDNIWIIGEEDGDPVRNNWNNTNVKQAEAKWEKRRGDLTTHLEFSKKHKRQRV